MIENGHEHEGLVFKEANTSYPRSFKVVDYRKPTGVVTVFGFSLF